MDIVTSYIGRCRQNLRNFVLLGEVLVLLLMGIPSQAVDVVEVDPPDGVRTAAPPNSSSNSDGKGSLWSEEKSGGFLFEDQKARRIGDIVTVRIIENSKGEKNASTKTEKGSALTASVASLFGIGVDKLALETGTTSKFDGSGSTSRSSQLTATVTVQVKDILPNGNLLIDGTREVVVNKERQYILISGVIRPEDIGSNNTILSTNIADAKISYTGSGVINDKQRPGWFVRLFDLLWPF